MSPALLSKRLKDLEAADIVARSQLAGDPAFYEYTLTSAGKDLGQVVFAIGEWGQKWVTTEVIARQVGPQPADVGYAPEHQHQAAATAAQ
jgi:DNA-binding HxlR family transcriptional regulator